VVSVVLPEFRDEAQGLFDGHLLLFRGELTHQGSLQGIHNLQSRHREQRERALESGCGSGVVPQV